MKEQPVDLAGPNPLSTKVSNRAPSFTAPFNHLCGLINTKRARAVLVKGYRADRGRVALVFAAYRDAVPIIDGGVKRQDVDHVFMRFGKRWTEAAARLESVDLPIQQVFFFLYYEPYYSS